MTTRHRSNIFIFINSHDLPKSPKVGAIITTHCTDERTEAQGALGTCLRSHCCRAKDETHYSGSRVHALGTPGRGWHAVGALKWMGTTSFSFYMSYLH